MSSLKTMLINTLRHHNIDILCGASIQGVSIDGCGMRAYLTLDHIVAVSEGGSDDIENLQLLCRDCHGRKHGVKNWGYVNRDQMEYKRLMRMKRMEEERDEGNKENT